MKGYREVSFGSLPTEVRDGGVLVTERWPAVKAHLSRNPVAWEFELLVRWPFYLALRMGTVQQALWFGRGRGNRFHALFNRILDKPRHPAEEW